MFVFALCITYMIFFYTTMRLRSEIKKKWAFQRVPVKPQSIKGTHTLNNLPFKHTDLNYRASTKT